MAEANHFMPFVRAHRRVFVCIYGAIAAYSLPLYSSFTWLPVAIPRIFGTEPSAVGMHMGIATAIATIVGLMLPALGGGVLRREVILPPIQMARVFLIVAILPLLLLLVARAPWQIYTAAGGQLALALATGVLVPGLLQKISPPGLRSRTFAILGIVGALAQGLSPVLVGAVSGLIAGRRGILEAIVIVGLPGWLIAALLISLAREPFIATVTHVDAMRA